jgi:hypothetical protein
MELELSSGFQNLLYWKNGEELLALRVAKGQKTLMESPKREATWRWQNFAIACAEAKPEGGASCRPALNTPMAQWDFPQINRNHHMEPTWHCCPPTVTSSWTVQPEQSYNGASNFLQRTANRSSRSISSKPLGSTAPQIS